MIDGLSLNNIIKTYPGVTALDDVSISFRIGEVHALVGENGSGKSTLVKIIAGAISPDSGSIHFNGNDYSTMNPIFSKKSGIAVVYQELVQFDAQKVYENVFIDQCNGKAFVNSKELKEETQKLLDLFCADISPNAVLRTLSIANRQIIEIIKAVAQNASIVILDEPTASISIEEQRRLFKIIQQMKERGITVIYISHRLEELFEICDRVSVLRDGRYITTKNIGEVDKQKLIQLMVGRELSKIYPEGCVPEDEVVLEVENLFGNGLNNISFKLHKGEILGFAGLVGAGRTELMHLLMGAAKKTSGKVFLNDQEVKIDSPSKALKVGINIIPEDRKVQGCFVEKSVLWNISASNLRQICRSIFINKKKENDQAAFYKNFLGIKTPNVDQTVLYLSGGNQQKTVVAKALAAKPKILIFDEPTRGIDIGARHEIYEIMIDLLKEGKSILMVSSDMEELLGMSNRIIVLHKREISGELNKSQFNQEKILKLASGLGD